MQKIEFSEITTGESTDEETRQIDELEAFFERRYAEERVGLRWDGGSLALVRRAADLAGVPYQTWIKMVCHRQAVNDLKDGAMASKTLHGRQG